MAKIAKEDLEKSTERAVFSGGTIKSLGGNRIGGHAVIFTDENRPDLQGDFFTKATDFFIDDESRVPILYHHGLRGLGSMVLGKAKCNIDDVGVWMEGELALRADYVKQLGTKKAKAIVKSLIQMITDEKLGYSTGSMPHLVETKAHENGTFEFTSWPIGEVSLTPTPVESQTKAVTIKSYNEMPVAKLCECETGECDCDATGAKPATERKSLPALLTQLIEDRADGESDVLRQTRKALAREALLDILQVEAILTGKKVPTNANLKAFSRVLGVDYAILRDLNKPAAGSGLPQTLKGIFEDELAAEQVRSWDLWNAYSCVIRKIANAKVGADLAAVEFDHEAKIVEATTEFSTRLLALVQQQVSDYLTSDYTDEQFYLRSLGDPSADDFFTARNIEFDDHLSLAVSAVRSVIERVGLNHKSRVKAGRVLSEKKLASALGFLDGIHSEEVKARGYFESMKPIATDTEKQKAMSEFLRNEITARQITATVDTINERQTEGSA